METSYDVLRPDLPAELEELRELALDLRWSWSHVADELWQRIDPELWHRTQNPWLILQMVSTRHLEQLARDQDFLQLLQTLREEQQTAARRPGWFQEQGHDEKLKTVAYFSMEYGMSEALPIYSGGLGVLAGDHLKTASELGLPLVAVGLGRVMLYLLDSNHPLNSPADRGITSELYGGGREMRLQQEMVLGIGGYAALEALGLEPEVCHLNEGHAALVVLERTRHLLQKEQVPFATAFTAVRAGNLFTTHTPVAAGFDRFDIPLMERYLGSYAKALELPFDHFLALGRAPGATADAPFQMAWLALRGSGAVNAVSDAYLHLGFCRIGPALDAGVRQGALARRAGRNGSRHETGQRRRGVGDAHPQPPPAGGVVA